MLIVRGLPPRHARGTPAGEAVELLNLVHVELQTSAAIAPRVAREPELNATCSLLLGTGGSPVQRWSCGVRMRERASGGGSQGSKLTSS